MQQGSLVCVGTGMMVGAHLSPICQSHIEQADVVFVCVAEHYMEAWITSLNKNTVNLQSLYGEGKNRHETYTQMINAMLERVEKGDKVVGAFYGHPGVFAKAPHEAIEIAKNKGFEAYMLPGISAESCLYADLRIDPGALGCHHYEANQFLLYKRAVDTAAYLVLWQVGVAGDFSSAVFTSSPEQRKKLTDKLLSIYQAEDRAILYEAATLPIDEFRASAIAIGELHNYEINQHTTLVIPPVEKLVIDDAEYAEGNK
ncbi:SAM-dependent methyltransferase [Alteromonas gracilis]|uniref:SAM-dependent methyltransferase n=1 Tax=Alteromonas gracilis TaxID=1479524 RepID=UPI0037350B33